MMEGVGALVTVELPADSPVLDLPWVVTFGPLDDEGDWEPVVCGPYERAHAFGLAQAVVADADAALADLRGRGVEAEGVSDMPWGRFVFFRDPDGNRWALQEVPDYAANAR